MPPTVSRVRLFARDPERMRKFYGETLGLRLVARRDGASEFDAGALRITIEPDPPFAAEDYRDFINQLKGNMRGMGASFHLDVEDVDAYFARLTEAGFVPVDPEKNRRLEAPIERPDGRREFGIEDPEGYWIYIGTG